MIPQIKTRTRLLVLQHPQEARNQWGTARLLTLSVPGSVHRVGLSWPSLAKVMGSPVQASRWGVLFLGTLKQYKPVPEAPGLYPLNGKKLPKLEGLVLLDGNWKQSKTLWWRNPWLLRLHRLVLNSQAPSLYTPLRRQPRKACLSTIEAAAECFSFLGESEQTSAALKQLFASFIDLANHRRQGALDSHPSGEMVPAAPELLSNTDHGNNSRSA